MAHCVGGRRHVLGRLPVRVCTQTGDLGWRPTQALNSRLLNVGDDKRRRGEWSTNE